MSIATNDSITVNPLASPADLPDGVREMLTDAADKNGVSLQLSRNPRHDHPTIRLRTEVDVLAHTVRVVPQEAPAAGVLHGYTVEHLHSATAEGGATPLTQTPTDLGTAVSIAVSKIGSLRE